MITASHGTTRATLTQAEGEAQRLALRALSGGPNPLRDAVCSCRADPGRESAGISTTYAVRYPPIAKVRLAQSAATPNDTGWRRLLQESRSRRLERLPSPIACLVPNVFQMGQ